MQKKKKKDLDLQSSRGQKHGSDDEEEYLISTGDQV